MVETREGSQPESRKNANTEKEEFVGTHSIKELVNLASTILSVEDWKDMGYMELCN